MSNARAIAFSFAGGVQLTWTPDVDVLITGVLFTSAVNAQLMVATTPAVVITDFNTPTTSFQHDDVLIYLNSNAISGCKFFPAGARLFVLAGTNLTLTASTTMSAILYVEDAIATAK